MPIEKKEVPHQDTDQIEGGYVPYRAALILTNCSPQQEKIAGGGDEAMDFSAFERWIKSPALKEVAAHWNEARQDRLMPSWSDINPTRIASHLSNVWSFKYDGEHDEFTGRLVGDRIARHIGKSFKDLLLEDAYPPEARDWAKNTYRRVVMEPALYCHLGIIFRQMNHAGSGERIVLPLSENGIRSDGVLGMSVFERILDAPVTLVTPTPGSERWLSLRPI